MSGGENSDKREDREIKACKKKTKQNKTKKKQQQKKPHDLVGIDSWNNLELMGAEESVGLSQFLDFQKRPS